MKKILRLVTTSVLTLTLVACGEASSSVSTSGTQTGSSVPASTSAFANVTSLTLSAASDGLTQVVGSIRPVTVTAALNANTNPSLTIKWFVNGVQQSATGRTLTFTPTGAGTFNVTAMIGDVNSNVLPVSVSNAVNVTSVAFDSPSRILVVGDAGANVTLTGATMLNTSRYDLRTGSYIIELERAVAQGSSVTVRLERAGGVPTTRTVVYDTRTIDLDEAKIILDSSNTITLDPTKPIRVIKPFGTTETEITYSLAFATSNMFFEGQAAKVVKLVTSVPTGAAAVATEEFSATNDPEPFLFEVTKDTVAGVYTHTLTVDSKKIEVKVEVVNPTANSLTLGTYETYLNSVLGPVSEDIDVEGGTGFWDYDTLKNPSFENKPVVMLAEYVNLSDATYIDNDIGDETLVTNFLTASADGVYQITKPFETETNVLQFSFVYLAQNFAYDETFGIANFLNINMQGPSEFLANSPLFNGVEAGTKAAAANALFANKFTAGITFAAFNATVAPTEGAYNLALNTVEGAMDWKDSNEHAIGLFTQFIDAETPEGLYTFTVSAGPLGSQKSFDVKLRVVKPAPRIFFDLAGYNHEYDVSGRTLQTELTANSITIYKPIKTNSEIEFGFEIILQNYHSFAVDPTSTELSNDLSVLENSNRKLFNKSEIATDGIFENNLAWFGSYDAYDLIDEQKTASAVASQFDDGEYYRFVDLQLSISGLSGLYTYAETFGLEDRSETLADHTIPRNRQTVVRAESFKSPFKEVEDEQSDFDDVYYVYNFARNISLRGFYFEIDSQTPTGTSTITVRVDNLSFTMTINIKEPSPFLMISEFAPTLPEATLDYLTADANGDLMAIDAALEFNGAGGITTKTRPDGKYRVFVDEVANASNILNYVTVADVKPGVYNWSVRREYPGGNSLITDSLTVTESNLTANDILDIDSFTGSLQLTKFKENFTLNRNDLVNSFVVGTYKYTFTFGSSVKVVEIEVLDNPRVVANWVQIGDVVARPVDMFDNLLLIDVNAFGNKALVNVPVYVNLSLKNVNVNDYTFVMSYLYDAGIWWDYSVDGDEEPFVLVDDFELEEFKFSSVGSTILIGYINFSLDNLELINQNSDRLIFEWTTNLYIEEIELDDAGLLDGTYVKDTDYIEYNNSIIIGFGSNQSISNLEFFNNSEAEPIS